jgi:prephenate dehydratase
MNIKEASLIEEVEKISVLGPRYSYTENASKLFLPNTETVLLPSITKAIEAVDSGLTELGLVPLENILNGLVGETLDCLLKFASTIEIVDSYQLVIKHFIGIKPDKKLNLNEIKKIYSHPQALEQSRDFIQEFCPNAFLVNCHSTSEATLKLQEDQENTSAAIASKEALTNAGLNVLTNTTSSHNATRFILIKRRGFHFQSPNYDADVSSRITSLLVHPGSDRKGLLLELLTIISGHFSANLSAIHSRPDGHGGFVFYLELSLSDRTQNLEDLLNHLKEYCRKETGGRAHINTLGTYFRDPFFTPLISDIAIIGANGAMGKWFSSFFQSIGLNVICIDTNSTQAEIEKLKSASVIIFSVPMHALGEAVTQYKNYISSKALVVENCSVKKEALFLLESEFKNSNEVLGIHTMFGPSIEILKRENVIVTKTESSGPMSTEFAQMFYKAGAVIHHGSVEEHDKAVSILQGLVQFSSLVLGNSLLNEIDNIEILKPYMTPNSRAVLGILAKVLKQSPDLLFDIQNQNKNTDLLKEDFLKSGRKLLKALEDRDTFKDLFSILSARLGPKLDNIQ